MKKILGLLGVGAVLLLSGCAGESGPSGLSISEPKPFTDVMKDVHEIYFVNEEPLRCHGIAPGPNGDGRFTCDWTTLKNPSQLTLAQDVNSDVEFSYLKKNDEIVPCVVFENKSTQWVSCGFGIIKR